MFKYSQLKLVAITALFSLLIGGLIVALPGPSHRNKPSLNPIAQQPGVVMYHGNDGQTALDGLKAVAHVVTKQSSYGEYVVSINGSDGGGKKYWLFYVNGKEASSGAGTYVTKASDTIEWRLQ